MTKDDREIVSAVLRALAGKVEKQRFAVWFGRGVRMERCGTKLRIAAADTRLKFLRKTFHAELAEVAQSVNLELEFVIEDVAVVTDEAQAAAQQDLPLSGDASGNDASQSSANRVDSVFVNDVAPAVPVLNNVRQNDEAARQRPPRRRFASLAEFVTSEPNRVALSAAHTAATRPGIYSPLTLVGPPGTGKTHLLEGIWRQVRTSHATTRVIYLTAEQFTNQFLEAIRHSGMPNFRRKVRDAEMLLIDDVQFFAGKQSTLIEVVNTIDTLIRSGRQLVFAVDRPPAELKALGPEIVTRLTGGLICTLEPADFVARRGILQQLAGRQNLAIGPDVLDWLASQLGGDARQLGGALNRLQASSEAHEQAIDLDFAQTALADLIHSSRRPVRLPEILAAVCDVLGVGSDEVRSASKSASATLPRMLAMFLARKWTRAALSEISRTVGRKSHSTVLSAQQKVTDWLAAGKTVPLAHGQCRVEDAIKRIESHLRLA